MDLIDARDRVFAVFFPERCVLCGNVVAYDDMWCGECECDKSGEIDCGIYPRYFVKAFAGLEYSGKVSEAVWKIKAKRDKRIFRFFAEQMYAIMKAHLNDICFDLVVPVPLSKIKLEKRGFNQAELIAAELGGIAKIPVSGGVLVQHDDSRVQHTLNKAERLVNAVKIFDVAQPEHIREKTVLLVDDVFTTGATVAACSEKLKKAGAKSIYALTAAWTPYDADRNG